MKDEYAQLKIPSNMAIEPCPVCGFDATLWEHITKDGGAQKVVMCSHGEAIGPQDAEVLAGCQLYMPPNDFYAATIREAISYWNEFAKALNALRRQNNWKRHSALRNENNHD